MPVDICPIWSTLATQSQSGRDGLDIDSARAGGRYFISGTAIAILSEIDNRARARLTTWLVDQRRNGVERPEITSEVLRDLPRLIAIDVLKRADRLLDLIEKNTSPLGEELSFDSDGKLFQNMMALSESVKEDEVYFLLNFLNQSGFIDLKLFLGGEGRLGVTVAGYMRLADLRALSVASSQAFVAMWFDGSMRATYEDGMAPAIRDAGYDPLRIDFKDHNNKIDDEIIAEIRRSRFLVADFTQGDGGARGGVYYEAGFAHGLNIPVIFTCRSDIIEKVHFDTRQYNHIAWANPLELRDRLAKRISATLGDGPGRKPG